MVFDTCIHVGCVCVFYSVVPCLSYFRQAFKDKYDQFFFNEKREIPHSFLNLITTFTPFHFFLNVISGDLNGIIALHIAGKEAACFKEENLGDY